MRALLLVLPAALLALLAACGDEPASGRPGPAAPVASETWFLAPEEVARLIQEETPGGLAWIPADTRETLEPGDLMRLKQLTEILGKMLIARLTLQDDGRFVLDLRREETDGAWRLVKATGPWTEPEPGHLHLAIETRESPHLAPLEIPDALEVHRVGRYLHLEALGRTIPLEQRTFGQ